MSVAECEYGFTDRWCYIRSSWKLMRGVSTCVTPSAIFLQFVIVQ